MGHFGDFLHRLSNWITPREFARVIDWQPPWDVGAPLPRVVAGEGRVFLLYLVNESAPAFDSMRPRVIDGRSNEARPFALVEFIDCVAYRFGSPNDEGMAGHRLYGRGLRHYAAHVVERSSWIGELERHRHSPLGGKETSTAYTHYVLCFKDEIFEAVAESYRTETLQTSFRQATLDMVARLHE